VCEVESRREKGYPGILAGVPVVAPTASVANLKIPDQRGAQYRIRLELSARFKNCVQSLHETFLSVVSKKTRETPHEQHHYVLLIVPGDTLCTAERRLFFGSCKLPQPWPKITNAANQVHTWAH
jgi:hypothetical protein